ncbi:MAG: ABC transporter permease [Acidobacteria bacterium]|nr:ABC transporter permease [Acidobacteriota bacterium]
MRGGAAWRWAVRRLLMAIPVIVAVTCLTFALIHLAPGDPIYLLAGDSGSPAYYDDMRQKYGLDQPLPVQFIRYAGAALSGDLGYSFMYQAPVASVLAQHAPASLLLGTAAMVLATLGGILLGVLCVRVPARADAAIRMTSSALYAAPVFWTGQILIILFAVQLGLVPVGGLTTAREPLAGFALARDVAWHLLLPALTLSLPFLAIILRVTRAATLEALQEPFVLAAAARGLGRGRIIARHAAAHAWAPVAALVGQHAAAIVAGAALTEALFGWPGIGYLVLHASLHRDYPLVTGAFLAISASVVIFNALADALCAWLDPRIALT